MSVKNGSGVVLGMLMLVAAQSAAAHDGHAGNGGLAAGLAHPFTGWDHLLAMLAVGVWSACRTDAARWQWPAAFLIAMSIGALLVSAGVRVPGVEAGIAVSLLVLGLLVAAAVRPSASVGAAVVGVFALFHGAAHGLELPFAAAWGYGLGMLAATATLLLAGQHLRLPGRRDWRGVFGGLVALSGAAALLSGLG